MPSTIRSCLPPMRLPMKTPTTLAAAFALAALSPVHARGPAYAQGPPPAAPQDAPSVRRSAADLEAAFAALQDEIEKATEAYRPKLVEANKRRRENPDDATI